MAVTNVDSKNQTGTSVEFAAINWIEEKYAVFEFSKCCLCPPQIKSQNPGACRLHFFSCRPAYELHNSIVAASYHMAPSLFRVNILQNVA